MWSITRQYVYYFPQYSPDGASLALLRWHGKDQGVSVYHFRDSSWTHVSDSLLFPHGWSADGRYVYAQLPWRQPLFRLDVRARRAPEHVLTAPFREVECAPAGPRRPGAFVCVAFDFVSDVWMIDNFDSHGR